MFLENIVIDAVARGGLGRFWEGLLGTTTLTDTDEGFETRLTVPDGPALDLCFPHVDEPPAPGPRVHLDISGGDDQSQVVRRALALGAAHLDIGQHDVAWVVLADPEGNPFCVMPTEQDAPSVPLAALQVDSGDPARDLAFWAELSGWVVQDTAATLMRHRSGRGPVVGFWPEPAAKGPGKNRLHLDLRLEPGDEMDEVAARVTTLGGAELHPDWGELPWRVFADPSGNEFCVLPVPPWSVTLLAGMAPG